ncbi:LptA/OstA family protein [Phreatobacter aquaticus]|nr:LptA/OstA family protein [Phreatobacter aquaticus]
MTLAGLVSPRLLPAAVACALGLAGLLAPQPASAQQAGSPFVGFTQNRNEPINFEADRAEVFDNDKKAVLSGNVRIRQGESSLQAARLVIFYEGGGTPGGTAAGAPAARPATTTARQGAPAGAAGGQQNVRRFEMEGGVIVRSKNQTATAERGVFDARRNEAIMEGNVVLTQCENVLRGSRLQADLTANRVRLDGGASTGGRVSGVLSGGPQAAGGAGTSNPDCAGPARPAARPRG